MLGLEAGQVVVLIHSGSRGLGHQVCTDYVALMNKVMPKYDITLPDRQLACAPIRSPEGQQYLGAMRAAANFAWANRQGILHFLRGAFRRVFGEARLDLVYDVCHNIAKRERYEVEGRKRDVLVHRKGATRAFPPGHREVPADYRAIGQPVFIPGSMGTASWVLVGRRRRHAGDLRQRLPRRRTPDVPHRRAQGPRRPRGDAASWRTPASWCAANRATASSRSCPKPTRTSTK